MVTLKHAAEQSSGEPCVLFVDDDPDTLVLYEHLFSRGPIRVLTAPSGLHALEILSKEKVSVVVSDYWMTGMDGIALLAEVERLYPEIQRLLLTGEPDSDIVLEAGVRVLTKGMDPGLIQRVILREAKRHAR